MYMEAEEVGRLAEASLHLSKSDPVMANLIADIGPCTLAKEEDYYAGLHFKPLHSADCPLPKRLLF